MIQIQDDNINQSASVSKPPVSSNFPAQPAQTNSNSSAEIDQLLAELDRLSKDLDKNPAANDETAEATAPVVQKSASSTVTESDSNASLPASDEKFDFDTFLADLEKKIDQESERSKSDKPIDSEVEEELPTAADFSDDFRKNRSASDMDDDGPDASTTTSEEELKSQNIFEMLGLGNITDEEKNHFLDELEMMIWDDFIVHDLELLLTSEEYVGAREILDKLGEYDSKKEALIIYLEKIVPDLDEVLYEKALELKSEMMGERLSKMKDGADQASLDKIKEAEDLISQNHWKSAVSLLNQLS